VRLYDGFLSGIGRVVIAKIPDKALRPVLFLLLALGAFYLFVGFERGVYAVVLNALATGLGLLLLLILWYRYRPIEINRSPSARNTENQGFRQALYFALIAGISVLNAQADVLMLGFMSTADNVGIYRIASRVASLVIFALIAVGASLAPRISALYARDDHTELQSLAFKGALATSVIGLPIALVLIFFGDWVLLLFGRDFQAGAVALSVLSIGQLINTFVGIVAVMLSMTGHEQKLAKIFAIAALLNVLMNAVLIPLYGVVGAASATAVSGILLNLGLALMAYKVLGVNSTMFGAVLWLLRGRQ
jgi:O-antigen/teichoic acid export membrane protein